MKLDHNSGVFVFLFRSRLIIFVWCDDVLLSKLSVMHAKLTFLHWRCGPTPFRKTFFIVESNVQVKSLSSDLMKFRQHFALVFKYTRWKRWMCEQSPRSNMHPKNNVKCSIPKFIQIIQKIIYLYVWFNYKNMSSQTVQTDNSRINTSINSNYPY